MVSAFSKVKSNQPKILSSLISSYKINDNTVFNFYNNLDGKLKFKISKIKNKTTIYDYDENEKIIFVRFFDENNRYILGYVPKLFS